MTRQFARPLAVTAVALGLTFGGAGIAAAAPSSATAAAPAATAGPLDGAIAELMGDAQNLPAFLCNLASTVAVPCLLPQ